MVIYRLPALKQSISRWTTDDNRQNKTDHILYNLKKYVFDIFSFANLTRE